MASLTCAAAAPKPVWRGPFAELSLPHTLTVLTDGAEQRLTLTKLLGQGGQGAVFATDSRRVVVKLCSADSEARRAALKRRFERLQCLGLEDLPIALPEAIVEAPSLQAVGYLAPWLEDMVPLQRWLTWPDGVGTIDPWYGQTGGLRRRLRVLAKVARLLAALHARGASYGDVSPGNIFVSESLDHEAVWLIDADNIRYVAEADSAVYTPRYGAPEIVGGQGRASLAADVFSFGLVAYEILTLCHPLLGDDVLDGEPEEEEAALRGELPWIDDPDDDSNATEQGYPREILLPKRLRRVAEATFGGGRLAPERRPAMSAWADALSRAAGHCVTCQRDGCGHSFRITLDACPFCDEPLRDDVARVDLRLFRRGDDLRDGGLIGPPLRSWVLDGDTPLHLPKSALFERRDWWAEAPYLTLTRTTRGVRISCEARDHGSARFDPHVAPPGTQAPQREGQRLGRAKVLDRRWCLHLQPAADVHRVLRVHFRRG